jgi:hypothetical protein
MTKIPFRVSARTARLIGRENIASSKGAIIELVKNGYDADSPLSLIYFHQERDCLYIIDSGDGMTQAVIEELWMTIGTDNKTNDIFAATGRVRAGAKGIGKILHSFSFTHQLVGGISDHNLGNAGASVVVGAHGKTVSTC